MKRLYGSLMLIVVFAVSAFGQNTSRTYSLAQGPMPTRQVASMDNYFAKPGTTNSYWGSNGYAVRLRKKRTGRFITTEPIIIPEPDLSDKPRVE
jgi:hypothetical protein